MKTLSVIMLLSLSPCLLSAPPQAPRPPQAPAVKSPCLCAVGVWCDCFRCECGVTHQVGTKPAQAPAAAGTQESRWRGEGWRQDAQGQWYRPLPSQPQQQQPVTYQPVLQSAPVFFGGFGGGGCAGGNCGGVSVGRRR